MRSIRVRRRHTSSRSSKNARCRITKRVAAIVLVGVLLTSGCGSASDGTASSKNALDPDACASAVADAVQDVLAGGGGSRSLIEQRLSGAAREAALRTYRSVRRLPRPERLGAVKPTARRACRS